MEQTVARDTATSGHRLGEGTQHLPGQMLGPFAHIGLGELGAASLMRREDTKYVFSAADLAEVLVGLEEQYDILDVNGLVVHEYLTLYFDDDHLGLFHAHHRGCGNRVKVRERLYVTTGQLFREAKFRSNKGVTTKYRTEAANWSDVIYPRSCEALQDLPVADMLRTRLAPVLRNAYKRITLVRKGQPERVTLDMNLSFSASSVAFGSEGFVVAEVKQARIDRSSPFMLRLKTLGLRPGGFSKYCIGVSLLSPQVRHNRFRPKLRALQAYTEVLAHAA